MVFDFTKQARFESRPLRYPHQVTIEEKQPANSVLEPGKLAGVVAVNGNPEQDITTMTRISFVMKDGVVYKDSK